MARKIGVVEYGAGNIASVEKAIDYAGADPVRVATPEAVLACDLLVMPGVGAAGQVIDSLRRAHIDEALTEAVRGRGTPYLGICIGMQILAQKHFEFGEHQGLGWIEGEVLPLERLGVADLPVPHMGWNAVDFAGADGGGALARRLGRHKQFYFAHSFAVRTPESDKILAVVDYGVELVAALSFDNVWATQFHPEKSQVAGDLLIQAFLEQF